LVDLTCPAWDSNPSLDDTNKKPPVHRPGVLKKPIKEQS